MSSPLSDYWHPSLGTKYRAYKAATADLASWLAKNVTRLGITFDRSASSTVNHSHRLKADQFLKFTEIITAATDPRINVPYYIVSIAKKAFLIRKSYTEILCGKDRQTDKGHDYFSSLIGDVYLKLREHYNSKADNKGLSLLGSNHGLIASFDQLKVEDIEAASEVEERKEKNLEGTIKQNSSDKKKKSKKARDRQKAWNLAHADDDIDFSKEEAFHLEEENEDPYFVLMCLLSDLLEMRKYIKSIWEEYKRGEVDLVTASLTTNAAFDIIRTYGDDFPAISSLLADYSKTMRLIFSRDASESNDDQGLKLFFNSQSTPSELELIGKSLTKMPDVAELTFSNAFYFLNGPRHQVVLRKVDGNIGINPMRNPFGENHRGIDRSKLSYAQCLKEDISILASYAQRFYYLGHGLTDLDLDQDHFSRLWTDFRATGYKTITLAHSLGTQLYLDIAHVLGEQVRYAYRDLMATTEILEESIDSCKENTPQDLYQDAPKLEGTSMMLYKLKQIFSSLSQHNDLTVVQMNGLYDKASKGKYYMSDDLSLLQMNPLLCGILEFQFVQAVRDIGMLLASHWRSITLAGQLYYSCKMQRECWEEDASGKKDGASIGNVVKSFRSDEHKTTPWRWDDMEYLFELLGVEAFFEGKVPMSGRDLEMYRNAWKYGRIATDQPRWEVAHKDRYTPPLIPPMLGEMKSAKMQTGHELIQWEPIAVTHRLYFSQYQPLEKVESRTSWTENSLIALVENYLDVGKNSGKDKGIKRRSGLHQTVSQVTLLSALKTALKAESRAFRFNLLSLHVRCFYISVTLSRSNAPLSIIDGYIRSMMESTQSKDAEIKKVDRIWGIAR